MKYANCLSVLKSYFLKCSFREFVVSQIIFLIFELLNHTADLRKHLLCSNSNQKKTLKICFYRTVCVPNKDNGYKE